MTMTDPLGDMLTRIRNGLLPQQVEGFDAGLQAARPRPRRARSPKATSAAIRQVDFDNGKAEFEIELKYYEGAPVIREIDRVSKPGRRVYVSVKSIPQRRQRPRHLDPLDAEGRDGRPHRPANRTSAAKSSAASSDRRRT